MKSTVTIPTTRTEAIASGYTPVPVGDSVRPGDLVVDNSRDLVFLTEIRPPSLLKVEPPYGYLRPPICSPPSQVLKVYISGFDSPLVTADLPKTFASSPEHQWALDQLEIIRLNRELAAKDAEIATLTKDRDEAWKGVPITPKAWTYYEVSDTHVLLFLSKDHAERLDSIIKERDAALAENAELRTKGKALTSYLMTFDEDTRVGLITAMPVSVLEGFDTALSQPSPDKNGHET